MFLLHNAASCITILHKKKCWNLCYQGYQGEMIIYYGIDIEWIKKFFIFRRKNERFPGVFFVSFFFQREYYVVYQEINFNQSNKRSPVINICRGRILTSLYPVNGFLSSCIKWFEAKTKTPIDTATVKIKP